MFRELGEITFPQRLRAERQPLAGFSVLEGRGALSRQRALRGIQHVKEHHIVAPRAQRSHRTLDQLRLLVAIRDDDDDSSPAQQAGSAGYDWSQLAAPRRPGTAQGVQDQLQVARRRGHDLLELSGKRHQAHPVSLALREPGERGHQEPPVVELADRAAGEIHRGRGIERKAD